MIIDDSLRSHLLATFGSLSAATPEDALPEPTTLSLFLEPMVSNDPIVIKPIDEKSASYFASAAVDIWLRSIHSFLVSAYLSETSPVWSSVSGYYSSHYAVRGLAHLLGYFQLFHKKRVVQLKFDQDHCTCVFRRKNKRGGEHQLYWDLVKQNSAFIGDDLFTQNLLDPTAYRKRQASEDFGKESYEGELRNRANYADHLFSYPALSSLDKNLLKERIEQISKIVCYAPPIPRIEKYPDLEYVQLIAYHRIIRFRKLLDDVLEGTNAFWEMYRTPAFAAEFMNFQLVEWDDLAAPNLQGG